MTIKTDANDSSSSEDVDTMRSDCSYYVPMRDGVRIAISLFFPGNIEPSTPAPTLLVQTRYGRSGLGGYGENGGYLKFKEIGYVIAVVDTRGSTSSFGPRDVEIGCDQVEDIDELVTHLVNQMWSNGTIIATGVSYMADMADISTSRSAPALKGAVIREVDFDVFLHIFYPGGVANDWFLDAWGTATMNMDLGRTVSPDGKTLDCRARAGDCAKLWPILQAVDDDQDCSLLREALDQRQRWLPGDYGDADFRDDLGKNGHTLFNSSPSYHLEGLRRESKPAQVWGSWMDAGTAAGALARYQSAPGVPMEIWITANNHEGNMNADPFSLHLTDPVLAFEKQLKIMENFFKKLENGESVNRVIHYYVLGTGEFKVTKSWPPPGTEKTHLFFGSKGQLLEDCPIEAGSDQYQVDFSATTGPTTRWSTQFGSPPVYADRREQDSKLLVYQTAPFTESLEIASTPVLDFYVATKSSDPAFHVYLEDVAPDGRVTYLVEGIFRAVNRRLADSSTLPYDQGPAPHSFCRADMKRVVPHEMMNITFSLYPIAAVIKKHHRLRVAIAGTDAEYFRRYSEGEADVFDVFWGTDTPSSMMVEMRPWTSE